MMPAAAVLDLPAAIRGRLRRRLAPSRPLRPGLPPGLAAEVLENVLGFSPADVRHQHLSGWKHAGAYRVLVERTGVTTTLVFKDAHYVPEHIAALDGLPLRPGPPEDVVYASADLAAWLPRVLWRQREANVRYRYLLEDLAPTHRRPGPRDVIALSRALPHLHAEVASVAVRHRQVFLSYDHGFTHDLLPYTAEALHRYGPDAPPAVAELLSRWREVERAHDLVTGTALAQVSGLHGDLNPANVLVPQRPGRAKLIDWEWAGYGPAVLDLAALLKGASFSLERRALEAYRREAGTADTSADLRRAFAWAKLLRAVFDAGFLAHQRTEGVLHGGLDLDAHIARAAGRALAASAELAGDRR